MEFQEILYTKEEGIATIILNRPQTLNSFTENMSEELVAAFEEARKDQEVRVVVLTGAGRAFCAGASPRVLASPEVAWSHTSPEPLVKRGERIRHIYHRLPLTLRYLDKPYIASINGPAAGIGVNLASMCDIRIASDRARFAMASMKMGVTPAQESYFLPRIVGAARALEWLWLDRSLDAREALAIGYVSRVVPHEELEAATRELASQLARGPTVALHLSKRLLYRCLDLDLEAALEAHETAQLIAQSTEDAKEGPRAWVEKREPIFKGR